MTMGADYSFELISIETYAPQFIEHNIFFLGSVVKECLNFICFHLRKVDDANKKLALSIRSDSYPKKISFVLQPPFKPNSGLNMLGFKSFVCLSFFIVWIEAGRQNFQTTEDPRITQILKKAKHRSMINSRKLKLILI